MTIARLCRLWLILPVLGAVAVSCGDGPDEVPPQSVPIATVVTLTPAQPAVTASGYADSCGELNARLDEARLRETGMGGGEDILRSFQEGLSALEPPPELADFHEARTTTYTSQSVTGPGPKSRAAFVREIEIVAAMSPNLRDILVSEGCLSDWGVNLGKHYLEARERIATRGQPANPPTLTDYAERCGDVRLTEPVMGSSAMSTQHLFLGLDELTPPPELEQYHATSIAILRHDASSGLVTPVPESLIEDARRATNTLAPDVRDVLMSTGCHVVITRSP